MASRDPVTFCISAQHIANLIPKSKSTEPENENTLQTRQKKMALIVFSDFTLLFCDQHSSPRESLVAV
jgi:hypothetical protein